MNWFRFLVVSYDSDQQQWFYDVVFAENKDAAKQRITEEVRPYVIDADVFDGAELGKATHAWTTMSQKESEGWLAEVK